MERVVYHQANKEMEIRFLNPHSAELYFRNIPGEAIRGTTSLLALLANAYLEMYTHQNNIAVAETFKTMNLSVMGKKSPMIDWIRTQGVAQGFTILHDDGFTVTAVRHHSNHQP